MTDEWLDWLDRHLLRLLAGLLVLRCGFLLINGLGLVGDESYYWDWSRHPDWCYYSKPPMVAWLIGVFTWLLGDSIAALRFPAVLLGTGFLWFFHATAQAFYGRRTAAFALLLMLATPDNVLANLIMTIDPPLYCFWMMSIYYLRLAIFDGQSRAWFWGGCAAAAALLSKQVAVALPMMLLCYLLLDRSRYRCFKREFWLYSLPMIIAGIPILIWNQQHEWVMFTHSKSHFTSQVASGMADSFKYARELIFYQLLLVSPLIFLAVLTASLQGVITLKKQPAERQFLLLMGPVLLLGVLLMSFGQKVQGNWPTPFYFTGLILLSAFRLQQGWKTVLNYGVKLGFVLVLMTYLLPVLLQLFNLQNSRFDPTKRFKYWQELAMAIQEQRQLALPNGDSFVVALGHRNLASELAFYLPDHPQVFRFESSGAVMSQYEIWPGPGRFRGGDALIVSDAHTNLSAPLQAAFQKISYLAEIPNPKSPKSPYFLYLGQKLINWPSSPQSPAIEDKL